MKFQVSATHSQFQEDIEQREWEVGAYGDGLWEGIESPGTL